VSRGAFAFLAGAVALLALLPSAAGTSVASASGPQEWQPAADGRRKTPPVLTYTAYGVYFCEARGAIDLLIYHDGTVLSTGQYRCDIGRMEREQTDVLQYHFPAKRVRNVLRRWQAFGVFDRPTESDYRTTDGHQILLDARFGRRQAVTTEAYNPARNAPLARADRYLSALVHRLGGGDPYTPRAYEMRVRRANTSWRHGTPWPYADTLDLTTMLGKRRLAPSFGDDLAALSDPFLYRVYRQDLEPNCTVRACKRAYLVYWRPLWPEE
jgi:hypothetical protein